MDLLNVVIRADTSGSDRASKSLDEMTGAARRADDAIEGVGASSAASGRKVSVGAADIDKATLSARAYAEALKVEAAADKLARAGASGAMRANTGNIAAQFQDIAVSAQGGMSAMTIGMQQGMQLASVISAMENPIKGVVGAFLSLLSPVSLLVIALTALAAAGLQAVHWPGVAAALMRSFAEAMEIAAPYAVGLAAALALIYAPTMIAGMVQVIAWIASLGLAALATGGQIAAAWIMANPVTALLAGIALAVTAMVMFRDQITKIFGRDIVGDIQHSANYIIGTLVGAFQAVKVTWAMLPAAIGDLVTQAANNTIGGIEGMLNFLATKINEFIEGINSVIKMLPEDFRGGWTGLGKVGKVSLDRVHNDNAGAAGNVMDRAGAIMANAQSYNWVGTAVSGVQHAANGAADAIRNLAGHLGDEKPSKKAQAAAERLAKAYDAIVQEGREFIADQERQASALGMSAEETARLKYQQDLLNDAIEKGIKLTPEQRGELSRLASEMANAEEQTRRAKNSFDFLKDATKGFLSDLRQGLKNGEGFFEAFGHAANNVLDKIIDKVEDQLVDALFSLNGGGAAGGGLSGIFGAIAHLFGFADGGYTGQGARYQPAGIVHAGEYVFSAAATSRIGVANLNAMHSAAKGYAGGGYVGAGPSVAPANQGIRVTLAWAKDSDGNIAPVVRDVARQEAGAAVGRAAPSILNAANKSAPTAVASYQKKVAGGDYRL